MAPPQDGASLMLQDYRHVWMNDPSHDRTLGQKRARQLLDTDIKKFEASLTRMERECRVQGDDGQPKKRDLGIERCEEIMSRLLDQFEAEEAKRGG